MRGFAAATRLTPRLRHPRLGAWSGRLPSPSPRTLRRRRGRVRAARRL